MKNKIIIISLIIISLILVTLYIMKKRPEKINYKKTEINIITSLEDKTYENTIWCGTFNILWNELKNKYVKQDIKFKNNTKMVDNLNLGTFTSKNINDENYIIFAEKTSKELKEKIKKAIKDKFNETSDVLDDLSWNNYSGNDLTLYTMLKKEFEFPNEFYQIISDETKETENIKYFGLTKNSDEKLHEQVEVLYYENDSNYGVKLLTKTSDEIILIKGIKKSTLKETYDELQIKIANQKNKKFKSEDTLKIPNLNFKIKTSFKELINKPFQFSNGEEYEITEAIQTISFELGKTGGKIKSEGGAGIKNTSLDENEGRNFNFDKNFTIFLKEKNKQLPYFGAIINDVEKFNQ